MQPFSEGAPAECVSDPTKMVQWCNVSKSLIINWSESFGYPCILKIPHWQGQLDWFSIINLEHESSELHVEPGVELLAPTDDPDIGSWQKTIPPEFLKLITPYCKHRFLMLRLSSQWKEASDLLVGNSMLFLLWLEFCVKNKLDEQQIRKGLQLKQPAMLERMGLVGTKSAVRMLRKVQSERIDATLTHKITTLWKNQDALASLRHYPNISELLLNLLYRTPELRNTTLFHTIAAIDCPWRRRALVNLLADCHRMGMRNNPALMACTTEQALRRMHDQRVEELNLGGNTARRSWLLDESGEPILFPEPPHAGTEYIRPITTPEDLEKEGKEMHHCVGSYVSDVQEGKSYIYKMLEPERMTISIKIRDGSAISIGQIAGVCNRPPAEETRKIVNSWFTQVLSA
ncbi:PcfJ domain-containing protein [Parendozoicomonas sp. Alg238-R29]|uniref:PcfJ domain-containing protein n=1 Tax=Parendozoicomonas sp. Alg238-R29 TaxID=2993446 RepID=UPI00248E3E61|nr:PcfJ domain-containing protein [Parendozoicomonas sp. Alg238-R29]